MRSRVRPLSDNGDCMRSYVKTYTIVDDSSPLRRHECDMKVSECYRTVGWSTSAGSSTELRAITIAILPGFPKLHRAAEPRTKVVLTTTSLAAQVQLYINFQTSMSPYKTSTIIVPSPKYS